MARIVEEVAITVKAGDGGKGCDSHIRLSEKKFMPTGGEGGRGGSIRIRADSNVANLKSFLYQKHFTAQSGTPGGSNHKKGKRGEDLVIPVPPGTAVFLKAKNFLIRDLAQGGEEVVLVEGGKGGMGNGGGKQAQPGQPGESAEILLSWKIPADVFLVGLPNSGKSKFLNRLTHSTAKQGHYPFTTKQPELGVYEAADFSQIRLCELPGLYRESAQGHGAGMDFLKHLQRAKMVLLMLDPLSSFAGSLKEGFQILTGLVDQFDKSLLKISQAVVVNKMDLPEARERVEKERFSPAAPLFLISAETGEGIEALMNYVTQKLKEVHV